MTTALAPTTNLPPGPPPRSANILSQLQFMREFGRDPLAFIGDLYDRYGDTVYFRIGDFNVFLLANPDHIHEVTVRQASKFHKGSDYKDTERGLARFLGNGLLTSDGEFWKRQRKLVQPALHVRRIEAYADTMVTYAEQMLDGWEDGARLDIDDEMMRLTLLIVARTLFDADASGAAARIGEVMTVFQRMANDPDILPNWVPTPKHLRERGALRDMDDIIYSIINERRGTDGHIDDRGDLLSMLLLAQDDEDGEGMTDKQVRDEAVTLFLAGHETTANALNWTWYLLAHNPEAEAKLHAELDAVLGGRSPTLTSRVSSSGDRSTEGGGSQNGSPWGG